MYQEEVAVHDPVASAFEAVAEAGEQAAKDAYRLAEQSRQAARQRADGATVAQAMAGGRPLEVLGLSERVAKGLMGAGAGLRKALMRGLADEGWGVSAISRFFGVSHQRVSALMQRSRSKA